MGLRLRDLAAYGFGSPARSEMSQPECCGTPLAGLRVLTSAVVMNSGNLPSAPDISERRSTVSLIWQAVTAPVPMAVIWAQRGRTYSRLFCRRSLA